MTSLPIQPRNRYSCRSWAPYCSARPSRQQWSPRLRWRRLAGRRTSTCWGSCRRSRRSPSCTSSLLPRLS